MNLMEILLLEAVRINNGREAYELIKNNKIGVKLDPSYKTAGEDIIPYLDKAINSVGVGNAPFAIQLLANKVPADQLKEATKNNTLREIVSYKNKPWAKEIPEYKSIIDFSSKEKYDKNKWNNLSIKLQSESQNHGKATKGSGALKDVKELYNDGTWTLQVPTSWEGAKAASFYGKQGGKQTPTQWCTRSNKNWYNNYTENNTKPLYVIRNWETGKSYQMAIRGNKVDFLDQDDEKGDDITKGDFTNIPDELLKKIPYGDDETMLDFKQAFDRAHKEIKDYEKDLDKIKANSKIKDPTNNPENARWGKTEKVTNEISKNVFLNYYEKALPEVKNPFKEAKRFDSAILPKKLKDSNNTGNKSWNSGFISGEKIDNFKHKEWAAKYYYNDDPNNFIIVRAKSKKDIKNIKPELRDREIGSMESYNRSFISTLNSPLKVGEKAFATDYDLLCYAYNNETKKIEKVKNINELEEFSKHDPKNLALTAFKDFGGEKTYRRNEVATEKEHLKKAIKMGEQVLRNDINNYLSPVLNKIFSENYKWNIDCYNIDIRPYLGKILPVSPNTVEVNLMTIVAKAEKHSIVINFYQRSGLRFVVIVPRSSQTAEANEAMDSYGRGKFIDEVEESLNKSFKSYALKALKNKDLKAIRMNERIRQDASKEKQSKTSKRLQYEEFIPNYFPY